MAEPGACRPAMELRALTPGPPGGGRLTHGRGAETALILVLVGVWGVCFVLIKAGLRQAPPIFFAALRAAVAAVPLVLVAGGLGRLRPPSGTWGGLALLGLTSTTVGLAGMYLSVGPAGAAIPSMLANTQALLVAPVAVALFGETLPMAKLGGLVVGFAGVALTATAPGAPLGTFEGSLLALLASAGLAGGSLVVKHIGLRLHFLTATAWQYVLGSLPLLVWALLTEEVGRTAWSATFVGALLFLGLAGSAGASLLWYLLLRRGELIRLSAYTLLTPVVGLLLALLLFREPLGPVAALGVGLTIAGVVAVEWVGRGRSIHDGHSEEGR